MDSQIEEIKNKLDVLEVVGNYVKLSKTGANYRGACPFHKEKTPSFFVSPARQMWHCFGCGKGGDIYEFVKEIEGVEFGDALRILAKRAGVELRRENVKLKTERARLYEICELACEFFEKQLSDPLASSAGKEAKSYLIGRGIKEESIKKWRLGYSPDTWQSLTDFLVGKGYNRDEVIKAGLAVAKQGRNDSYDRFRGRIIFPIFDSNSQVVGFGARIFKQKDASETAKYINTPQGLLYDKSNLLYGLNFAKLFARKENKIILVEGYTDTIMCHQAGFENTVATSGTALTQRHLEILKRYTDNLVLAFDMDSAGQNATSRGIDLAQEKGFSIKVIESYGAKDPADIIAEDKSKWSQVLEKAKPIMDYYFDSAFLKFDKSSPEGKREISKIVLSGIKRIANKIEQSFWIQKLSQKLSVKEEAIEAELEKIKLNIFTEKTIGSGSLPKLDSGGRKAMIEERIISLIMKNPQDMALVGEDCYGLFSQETKELFQKIKEQAAGGQVDIALKKIMDTMALKAEIGYTADSGEEIPVCLAELKMLELKKRLAEISDKISYAESEGKHEEVADLMSQFSRLSKELNLN